MDKLQLLIQQRSGLLKEKYKRENELSEYKSRLSVIEREIEFAQRLKNKYNLRSI
jgi:hypothetical protein